MKKILFYACFLFLPSLLLLACEKNILGTSELIRVVIPPDAPLVAYVGRELAFDVEVAAEAGLEKVETRMNFTPIEGTSQVDFDSSVSGTYSFSFIPNQVDVGKNLDFAIVVYDQQGFTSIANYRVKVEEPPVNISLHIPDTAPEEVAVGTDVKFEVMVVSEIELVKIETLVQGLVVDSLTQTHFEDLSSTGYRFSYTPAETDAGAELAFTIRATDKEEKTSEATYLLFIHGERELGPVVFYTSELGSQASTDYGHFLDLKKGNVYFSQGTTAISADIDLVLFYSASTRGNLCAPDFENAAKFIYTEADFGQDALGLWPIRKSTKLVDVSASVTDAEFEAIETDDALIDIFEKAGAATNVLSAVEPGNIVAFLTADNKYGLIRVMKVPKDKADSITLEVRVQTDSFL